MFKRKQWASAVRRGRKHVKYDEDVASHMKANEELKEESPGRRKDETHKKMRIMKITRKRKKRDITSHLPLPPLEEFSDIEKEYNPSNTLTKPLIVSSRCCHHNNEYPSSSLPSSHSPIHYSCDRRKKRENHNHAGKNLTHKRPYRVVKKEGKRKMLTKRTRRRMINFMAAVGIKLLIALLASTPCI